MDTTVDRFKSAVYLLPKIDFFSQGGRGRVTHAIGLGNGLVRNNLRVTMISGPGLAQFQLRLEREIKIVEVGAPNRKARIISRLVWPLKLYRRLRKHLENSDGKLIITRYAVGNILLQLLMTRGLLDNHTLVLEVNSLAFHQYAALPQLIRALILKIEIGLLNRFDVVYAVSENLRGDLLAGGLTVPAVVVPNASDASRLDMLADNVDNAPVRFIYLGQFHNYYDFDFLVSAFLRLKETKPDTELHLWGGGKLADTIESLAKKDDAIRLHGRFNENNLQGRFNPASDIFVLPSRPGSAAEITSPIKLFEYMSYGVPVLAAEVGQIPEILEHGKTAYLYNPHDLDSLVSLMASTVDNRAERKTVGECAREEQLNHHTWQERAATLLWEIGSRTATDNLTLKA
jgi:glycosyltransferase involved in cell wall biosynthesis|tara:strand:- start:4324 stop:5526 length:1203 start_codon:yes stop_codon:yes gene_type:complete